MSEEVLNTSEYLRAEKAALRLISRAEQCTAGLARKLEKRKFDTACINAVISHLCEIGLLDDNRFARLWLESRLRLARSPKRLLSALCARGIARDDAEAAVKNVLDEDAENSMLAKFAARFAKQIAKKHARKSGGESEDVTRKLKYLLKSEGFSQTAIQSFLEN